MSGEVTPYTAKNKDTNFMLCTSHTHNRLSFQDTLKWQKMRPPHTYPNRTVSHIHIAYLTAHLKEGIGSLSML